MYLVFDTETTGFPSWNSPLTDPKQARICQLACMLLDSSFKERASFVTLIKPDGWYISSGAQSAHGISVDDCNSHGLPIQVAMTMFAALMERADYTICHNAKFDNFMINIELVRLMSDVYDWDQHSICTMEQATEVCKLEKKSNRGPGIYKWPSLTELYRFCFNEDHTDAHHAMGDVKATAKCFAWLKQNNHIVYPSGITA